MVRILDEQTIELNLPSKNGYERVAMECSASFAKMAGFVPDRIEDLKSAVAEACINAMQHGNKWRPEARVVANMNFRDDTLIVSIIDQGEGMPEIPEYQGIVKIIEKNETPRGLGIFLIRQLVDQVKFNQMTPDGHTVIMEIKRTK